MRNNIYDRIKKHNYFVEQKFIRSEKSEFISLTDILISKEKIIKELAKYEYNITIIRKTDRGNGEKLSN